MRTVSEVGRLTGVSVRTLQYYDSIGLLHPAGHTEAGYRLYDDAALETLQQILLLRELEFPLKEIRRIIQNPEYDREKAIDQQIELLRLKKEHLENLIDQAQKLKQGGISVTDFSAFDKSRMEEYARQAKAEWGSTKEYLEYEHKAGKRSEEENRELNRRMMRIFAKIGEERNGDPASEKVQGFVKELQDFITEHFYTCTAQILAGLGRMYAAGGEMTLNIDRAGGEGTGVFADKAIQAYCAADRPVDR